MQPITYKHHGPPYLSILDHLSEDLIVTAHGLTAVLAVCGRIFQLILTVHLAVQLAEDFGIGLLNNRKIRTVPSYWFSSVLTLLLLSHNDTRTHTPSLYIRLNFNPQSSPQAQAVASSLWRKRRRTDMPRQRGGEQTIGSSWWERI